MVWSPFSCRSLQGKTIYQNTISGYYCVTSGYYTRILYRDTTHQDTIPGYYTRIDAHHLAGCPTATERPWRHALSLDHPTREGNKQLKIITRKHLELTFSDCIPDLTLRSSCMWPPTPSKSPMCTHRLRMYVPASQLTQNTAATISNKFQEYLSNVST